MDKWRTDLDAVPKWPTEVLFWNGKHGYATCDVRNSADWEEYTHWMPLPTPPDRGTGNG